MAAELIERDGHQITQQVTLDISGTMLEAKGRIQEACNEMGRVASAEKLTGFDTDGAPIVIDGVKWTKRGVSPRL